MKEPMKIGSLKKSDVASGEAEPRTPEKDDLSKKLAFHLRLDSDDLQTLGTFSMLMLGLIVFAASLGMAIRIFLLASGLGS